MGMSPARLRRHQQEALVRESRALEMYARGARSADIAAEIGVTANYVSRLVARALERRAQEEGPTVDAARTAYLLRTEAMVQALMPVALGGGTNDDGTPRLPDARTGELLLKVLDRQLAVQSQAGGQAIAAAQDQQRIDLHLHVDHGQSLREQIEAQLAETRAHMRVVDGELAQVGTELDRLSGHPELDSRPAAPAAWQPPEQGEDAA